MLHARTLADAPGLFISHVQLLGFREGRVFPKAGQWPEQSWGANAGLRGCNTWRWLFLCSQILRAL